jgi:hypothetical protein
VAQRLGQPGGRPSHQARAPPRPGEHALAGWKIDSTQFQIKSFKFLQIFEN